ncbi:protein FAR1-RELATED SEQUENCE 5-like [Gastrolobium bilobum]|uniref:protein FAR1-RELATED SEQUENCE 5-like n=1 Tax=Gastrolobium bilobum TaxID=150636 RepID=UPI002AAF92D9|nr:protein FAR1-RELATED SEQUENCE 5-like [Gastrolobium bilobum]
MLSATEDREVVRVLEDCEWKELNGLSPSKVDMQGMKDPLLDSNSNFSQMNVEPNISSDNILVTDSILPVDMPQSPDVDEIIVQPYVGMEFESLKNVEHFYKLFAKAKGFGVRIRSSKNNYGLFVCCKHGENSKKKNDDRGNYKKKSSTIRSGCKASLSVTKDKNRGIWVIKSFDNNHNHIMASPKSVSYLRCHKKMNGVARKFVEKFNDEGMPTGKVAAMFSGNDLAFSNRDYWNHLRNLGRKNLDVGDALAVFNYCKQKQSQNPDFFYSIQCDADDRMINFFWVDARSRYAYQQFGDVITFDTTYRTNKYSMSFAPFTGLNHHLQSILFGCALLRDETEKSFIWLFETWLEAMNGKKPISIITDQDLAIGAIVAKTQFSKLSDLAKRSEYAYKYIVTELDRIYDVASTMETEMLDVNEAPLEFELTKFDM